MVIEADNEFYKTNDIFEEERILNLYKDSDKKLRILWKYDVSFYINMDKINMKREEVVKITCPICGEVVTVDKIITFDCDDKACVDCVREYLLSRYDVGNWDFNIPCFNNCSKGYGLKYPDSIYVIRELIGQEKYEKMADKAAFDFANYRCANKNCNVVFSLGENNNNPFFICTSCNTHTCLKCSEIRHDGTLCPSLVLKMKDVLKNERMGICPKCFEVYTMKGDDHVTCLKCKIDFCFSCSAVRSPALVHGNHYHRPDCINYYPYENFDDVYSERCSECVLNKSICKRPISMKEFYTGLGGKDLLISYDKKEEEKIE